MHDLVLSTEVGIFDLIDVTILLDDDSIPKPLPDYSTNHAHFDRQINVSNMERPRVITKEEFDKGLRSYDTNKGSRGITTSAA